MQEHLTSDSFVKILKKYRRISVEVFYLMPLEDAIFVVSGLTFSLVSTIQVTSDENLLSPDIDKYWIDNLIGCLYSLLESLASRNVDAFVESLEDFDSILVSLEADVAAKQKGK